jgi:anti-sigma B factor antagonist
MLQTPKRAPLADFQIQSSQHSGGGQNPPVKVVNVKGALDANTFLSLQKELEGTLRANHSKVVLDCDGLEYMSSAGLGVLKKYVHDFRGAGGDIRIARVPEKIGNIIKLLGFSKVFKIFTSLDDAVSSFRPAKPE